MSDSLYDSFIADYYDESPIVKGRLQDVAFYRNAVRDFGDPILEMGCGECVRKHLASGGRLILDVFQTDAERMHDPIHMREVQLTEYETADGRHVRISERVAAFHRAEQRNDVEMIFSISHRDGRKE